MAAKTELDAIDRRILRILSQDGRSSYQAIADEVGLSRPAVMERVKRLEETGHILGYRVQLDRVKAGLPVTAFSAAARKVSVFWAALPPAASISTTAVQVARRVKCMVFLDEDLGSASGSGSSRPQMPATAGAKCSED